MRGGQFPEIRTRSTLKALDKPPPAADAAESAQRLAEAYVFLRRVEHRIQYLDDQQTHLLPAADADLAWIAASLACRRVRALLLPELGEVREVVATEFDALHDGRDPPPRQAAAKAAAALPLAVDSEAFLASSRRRWPSGCGRGANGR